MTGFLSLAEARKRSGLRMVLLRGVPSPWSQAAKGILHVKRIPYTACALGEGESVQDLIEWTGQDSYPAAMYEDERGRSGWAEILLLAERLAPEPRLLPKQPGRRALCLGMAFEICGEMGLGWCRRLCAVHAGYQADPPDPMARWLGDKYGYRPDAHAAAETRVVEVLGLLHDTLREHGGEYLLGELTALDLYWATFCNLIAPLPPEQLPLPEPMRALFTAREPAVQAALTPELLSLRDRVYQRHLVLPVEL